ncbi:helix-turn-helix domain-containing protein [Paenibacillus typhae]|uniref:helix-turn-helix domain-containing protein n=1 Tax=Paenibacillus typhae TaxID=1174501 RepID=UPI001113FF8C
MRIHQLKFLLLNQQVADASFRIGYESPTKFSREYSRMFGCPPREDMKGVNELN